jgi:hypothetical protein
MRVESWVYRVLNTSTSRVSDGYYTTSKEYDQDGSGEIDELTKPRPRAFTHHCFPISSIRAQPASRYYTMF